MLTLTLKRAPHVPLEAEAIAPDRLAALSLAEIRAQPVFLGKRQLPLEELFDIQGQPGEAIEIHGDCSRVRWIGRGMSRGSIRVVGNAGMHLGSYMRGGSIEVTGDGSDWVGGEMSGGSIRVAGNAGGQIGAAYRGSMGGMRGGSIVIGGSAGLEVGMRMKRGTIVIGGPVRDFTGLQMKGGTIVLQKGAELRTGAWMTRGTIISLGPLPLLPTFAHSCDYAPTFLGLYERHLSKLGVPFPKASDGQWRLYRGDSCVPGKGEILLWRAGR